MAEECASCGSDDTTETIEPGVMNYGEANTLPIHYEAPVVHCRKCGFSFTDHRCETIRDEAVKAFTDSAIERMARAAAWAAAECHAGFTKVERQNILEGQLGFYRKIATTMFNAFFRNE